LAPFGQPVHLYQTPAEISQTGVSALFQAGSFSHVLPSALAVVHATVGLSPAAFHGFHPYSRALQIFVSFLCFWPCRFFPRFPCSDQLRLQFLPLQSPAVVVHRMPPPIVGFCSILFSRAREGCPKVLTSLLTCCGPLAKLACLAKTTGGFLIAARVSSVARHWFCARRASFIKVSRFGIAD